LCYFFFVKNSNSMVWKYLIFNCHSFDKIYNFIDKKFNDFFKKTFSTKNLTLVDYLFPIEKLNLSIQDINFVKEFLKIEVNLEIRSLKQMIVLLELKKKEISKKV